VTKNYLTLNFAKQLNFWFQVNLANKNKNKKMRKAMGHQTKKAKANQITDPIGKLLRKNEELPKKKGENNGCKMKKTGDKDFCKKLTSVEQLKKPEEIKTKKTLRLE